MKRNFPIDDESRFSGQLRHYHRSGAKPQRTWDEWVDGDELKSGNTSKRLKIAGILVAVLVLGAIIAGLVSALQ